MANPVLIADVETRYRTLTDAERPGAQALIDDAWVILLARRPGLEAHIAEGAVSDGLVRAVLCAMIVRVLRNPEGYKRWGIDDGTFERDAAVSAGALYVSDDELTLLAPGGVGDGAFTIRPYGAVRAYPPDPWVPGLSL